MKKNDIKAYIEAADEEIEALLEEAAYRVQRTKTLLAEIDKELTK